MKDIEIKIKISQGIFTLDYKKKRKPWKCVSPIFYEEADKISDVLFKLSWG